MLFILPILFATSQVPTIVGWAIGIVLGAGASYGWQQRRKDQSAGIWKGLSEALQAENKHQAEEVAELRAQMGLMNSQFVRDLAREIVVAVRRDLKDEGK